MSDANRTPLDACLCGCHSLKKLVCRTPCCSVCPRCSGRIRVGWKEPHRTNCSGGRRDNEREKQVPKVVVTFRLAPTDKKRLLDYARSDMRTPSFVVNLAVWEFLERHGL